MNHTDSLDGARTEHSDVGRFKEEVTSSQQHKVC